MLPLMLLNVGGLKDSDNSRTTIGCSQAPQTAAAIDTMAFDLALQTIVNATDAAGQCGQSRISMAIHNNRPSRTPAQSENIC